jgi:tetratricopeptide (TPR) repeat protein
MMKRAKSSQQRGRLSAALLLATAATLAIASTTPDQAFGFWFGNDKKPTKKCPSGKVWSDRQKKCVTPRSGALSDEDLARAGRQLAKDGSYREAIRLLEMAANQDNPVVLTYLGYSHRKLANIDLGISYYKKALDIDPDNIDTREYLGEGYVSKGELDLAWLELMEIEKRCGTTCEEYQALEKVLRSGRSRY